MTVNNWGKARKAATTVLEGDFPTVVTECVAGKSSGDKEQLKLKLTITSGEYVGRKLYDTITVSPESPGAMAMFFQAMDAFGLDDKFFNTCPDGAQGTALIATRLQGKEIVATLRGESYQGVLREKVKGYKRNGTAVGGLAASSSPAPVALVLPAPIKVQPATAPPVFGGGDAVALTVLATETAADLITATEAPAASTDPYDETPAF